jgi:periplasmic divalent cation tolerance protein
MKYVIVRITIDSEKGAQSLANELLKNKLIACANISSTFSTYWWKGEIEDNEEFVIMAKTKASLFKKVEKFVKEFHPYEIPCIVALPIVDGNKECLDWIDESVE